MLRRTNLLDVFERKQLRQPRMLEKKLRLYDGMLEEARRLGVIPLEDPLDKIEEDIRRARMLRSLSLRCAYFRSDFSMTSTNFSR